jgi:hypothetical protein
MGLKPLHITGYGFDPQGIAVVDRFLDPGGNFGAPR